MAFIKAEKLKHIFIRRDDDGKEIDRLVALDDVDLEVEAGQFIAILGHNGSGKSTFAKHLNVLLEPTEGSLWVDGRDVTDSEQTWEIRQSAGMVFQNPDNQIVAGVVEEDVAFGPENLGIPTEDIWTRVAQSLEAVGMTSYRYHSPNRLSGGQKQRIAIAGVVAMRPKCIVMDEPTAMLDPHGREEVLKTIHQLNREENVTVILITHYMEEVADADQVFVMDNGRVVMHGTPRNIFERVEELHRYGLDVPQISRLAYDLKKEGFALPEGILSRQELVEAFCQRREFSLNYEENLRGVNNTAQRGRSADADGSRADVDHTLAAPRKKEEIMRLEDVSYLYSKGTSYEIQALRDINLTLYKGEFIGIIGHTGSGKSTMIQLLNGLLKASSGNIFFENANIYGERYSLNGLRTKVGLVFQYPEYQLFETTVLRDVAYGPKNQGLSEEEAYERARQALRSVRLPEEFWEMSPFELSGGQKRRTAIAGVIAMNPEVLILDEPTAGLDPKGRDELFALIRELHETRHITILLVTHSMEDVANYVDRIIVMRDGSVMLDDETKKVFLHIEELENAGLAAPQVTYLMHDLAKAGFRVRTDVTTIEEAKREILKVC